VRCTKCGFENPLELRQGQLRNVVGRCEGCGASIRIQMERGARTMSIISQANYIVWRDGIVGYGKHGGDRKSDQIAKVDPILPAADPGHDIAHRWRKWLCFKRSMDLIFSAILDGIGRDYQCHCVNQYSYIEKYNFGVRAERC
jgi:hypothetical protein